MDEVDLATRLGPAFAAAFAERGYTTLTSVQDAALDPDVKDCDLRISSQTGSGKTVAIGFALRDLLGPAPAEAAPAASAGPAKPAALVIVPTRELAKQVEQELAWLFSHTGRRVASVTGGASYRDERRALSAAPAIVVGTPGRLLDQLARGAIDTTGVRAVALDEADRMLDMGFREDIENIFAKVPEGRRTHLVSATFPRDVLALADAVQTDPILIEGTPLGVANADIDHVVHIVLPHERTDAIVNLLLSRPGAQTLIFARTRADVADLANTLADAGFAVSALSGEMEQRERNRALTAFRAGDLDALVATDVAARGIDVQDVARVIHAEPPTDADSYTHRSGRTGRAGKKGQSIVLVIPAGIARAKFLLRRAGVQARLEPLPSPDAILGARDEMVLADLTGDAELPAVPDERTIALAERILGEGHAVRAIARLLAQRFARRMTPRDVTPVEARAPEPRRQTQRPPPPMREKPSTHPDDWAAFRVTWGEAHGADARRLVAMLCRRGGIEGSDIGSIRVARSFSVVQIKKGVAEAFAAAAAQPDPRDARVKIARFEGPPERPDRRPAPPDRRPAPPDRRPAPPDRRPAPPDRRPAPPDRRPAPPDRRPAPPDRRPAPPDRRPASPDRSPAPTERQADPRETPRPRKARPEQPQRRGFGPPAKKAKLGRGGRPGGRAPKR